MERSQSLVDLMVKVVQDCANKGLFWSNLCKPTTAGSTMRTGGSLLSVASIFLRYSSRPMGTAAYTMTDVGNTKGNAGISILPLGNTICCAAEAMESEGFFPRTWSNCLQGTAKPIK
ncbi:hypothetical protein FAZ15_11550 [Sphingobacterium olei]|uniref:Uncharacterized protein n=1 Tax=Sphingobacterium olei TaxID=2571155 RepID=A0A4U0P0R6_9SPHI|nr:hypothetical protein [Sphingobacterium olei]TJZ60620.1 hypothetical protein FAZ15_11550 [Sphingobacterium olei]